MDKNSTAYTLGFAAAITIVCAVLLGFAATSLKEQQEQNADVDKKSKILLAVGEFDPNNKIPATDVIMFNNLIEVYDLNLDLQKQDLEKVLAKIILVCIEDAKHFS